MAAIGEELATNNPLASEQAQNLEGPSAVDALQVEQRYDEERAKRVRKDAEEQYIDTSVSEKFGRFQEDPWLEELGAAKRDPRAMFSDDDDNGCQIMILGAGWGGLMYAVRMVEAGVDPKRLRIIDPAAGFGGTWYWNRYPGLMCDVESYTYLPLLEETGFVPRHRYSYGEEIRRYAELIAEKWGVAGSAVFQTKAQKLVWKEVDKQWEVELCYRPKGGDEPGQTFNVRTQFVVTANGVLSWPKLPNIKGILDYRGDVFHTSRWQYSITGGAPGDPNLLKLQDKRVALVGTGATGIQVVPHLARWSKHLYVVQRTPSAIDVRNQHETDPEWFSKEVARGKGWQRERLKNFHLHFSTGEKPSNNMVGDGWTYATTMAAFAGDPAGPKSPEELSAYVRKLHDIDHPRSSRVRARVEEVVKDKDTAKNLQAWYPTWCKRPCFHDDFLKSFNESNVTLLDTAGKGLDRLTKDSIVVQGKEYPVDIVIFATGFREPYGGSPAERANITVIGRDGVSMSDIWAKEGPSTLHGILDKNFPNLFLASLWQAALAADNVFHLDQFAQHAAHIMQEAKRNAGNARFAVSPTPAATEDWARQIQKRAAGGGAVGGCTPGYYNMEAAIAELPQEVLERVSKSGPWGGGVEDYVKWIENWRTNGGMQRDIVVTI